MVLCESAGQCELATIDESRELGLKQKGFATYGMIVIAMPEGYAICYRVDSNLLDIDISDQATFEAYDGLIKA